MSNIQNAFGNDLIALTPWDTDVGFREDPVCSFAIPDSGSTTFYNGQAVGRNAAGNLVQMDDTLKAEFFGILTDIASPGYTTVYSTDALGDKKGRVKRPVLYEALLPNAAKGIEGQKVWWLYNQQVALNGLTCWNYAGTIIAVPEPSTATSHVIIQAPWCNHVTLNGDRGWAPITDTTTLTKYDVGKMQVLNFTGSKTITLPPASACSPGDTINFTNINASSGTPTIAPDATIPDTINGGSSYTAATAQYSQFTLRTDGISAWYVVTPNASGTLGATTFTGAVAVSGAVTVTDAAANALAVGPNGATNPTLTVDGSVSSAITGINIIGRATGAGVTLATLGGTDEDLLVAPKGAGGVKVTSHAANALAVGRLGSTTPALQVNAATSTCITGLLITAAASGNGLAIKAQGETNVNTTIDANGNGTLTLNGTATGNVLSATSFLVKASVSAGGVGYAAGAGGTVAQGSSRTTGVTLSKLSGTITLVSAAGSATPFTFTVTNTLVAATDTVIVSQKSGTDAYSAVVSAVAAGSYNVTITDLTGTTTETPAFNAVVIKGVAA